MGCANSVDRARRQRLLARSGVDRRRPIRAAWCLAGALLLFGCKVEILHDLPEAEANEVVAVLQQHGIVPEKILADAEQNTWTLAVNQDSTTRVWSILSEYKLPRIRERRFQDVFGQSKLVVTPIEEKALYLEALQGEIVSTLESVDAVIDARVHLVLPQRDLTGTTTGAAKASVVVEYQPTSQGQSPIQVGEIQRIVGNAVDQLSPDAVAVILKPSTMAQPQGGVGAGHFELVNSAGLTLEQGSLRTFKLYVGVVMALFAVLGGLYVWQGRLINHMRGELSKAQKQFQALQRRTQKEG